MKTDTETIRANCEWVESSSGAGWWFLVLTDDPEGKPPRDATVHPYLYSIPLPVEDADKFSPAQLQIEKAKRKKEALDRLVELVLDFLEKNPTFRYKLFSVCHAPQSFDSP